MNTDIKKMLTLAGVDITQGKARQLVESQENHVAPSHVSHKYKGPAWTVATATAAVGQAYMKLAAREEAKIKAMSPEQRQEHQGIESVADFQDIALYNNPKGQSANEFLDDNISEREYAKLYHKWMDDAYAKHPLGC